MHASPLIARKQPTSFYKCQGFGYLEDSSGGVLHSTLATAINYRIPSIFLALPSNWTFALLNRTGGGHAIAFQPLEPVEKALP